MSILPALSLPDPLVSGEGVLDPLGLANFADRLAEELVPGVRARQNRVRFLTAMVVAAAVVEGLDDTPTAQDGTTPQLAFEWLLVEGLVRASDAETYRGTAGTFKARDAIDRKVSMSAKTYLKTPTVFGFHGIYKTLAEDLELLDQDMHLHENGRDLLDRWEREQGLSGFIERANQLEGKGGWREKLRSAVESALTAGYSTKESTWGGWKFFADHLAPSKMGREESKAIHRLLTGDDGGTRAEVFSKLGAIRSGEFTDDEIGRDVLRSSASAAMAQKLDAIDAYEHFCSLLEYAFDGICFSGRDPLTPARVSTFFPADDADRLVADFRAALIRVDRSLQDFDLRLQEEFGDIALEVNAVQTAEQLFAGILARHHTVQSRKPPAGKRDWFERTSDGGAIARTAYRASEPPERNTGWGRPYRLMACLRFTRDLARAGNGA